MRTTSLVATLSFAILLIAAPGRASLVAPGYSLDFTAPAPLTINGYAASAGDGEAELGALLGVGTLDAPLTVDDFSTQLSASPLTFDTFDIPIGAEAAVFQFDIGPGTSGFFQLAIAFDAPILGVIFQGDPNDSAPDTLQDAVASLGPDADYTTRPIYAPGANDISYTVTDNIAIISGTFNSLTDIDSFMIATAAIPEPGPVLAATLLSAFGIVTVGRRSAGSSDED